MIPRLVIFDMDGTLVNSMPSLHRNAVAVMTRHFGIPVNRATDEYLRTVGAPFREQLHMIFGTDNPNITPAVNEYEAMHLAEADSFPLGGYTEIVLRELAIRKMKTALVTSTSKVIVRAMPQVQALSLNYIFGHARGVDKDAQIAKACMYAGHVRPTEAVYIGDSDSDGHLAASMGITFQQANVDTLQTIMRALFVTWDHIARVSEDRARAVR